MCPTNWPTFGYFLLNIDDDDDDDFIKPSGLWLKRACFYLFVFTKNTQIDWFIMNENYHVVELDFDINDEWTKQKQIDTIHHSQ